MAERKTFEVDLVLGVDSAGKPVRETYDVERLVVRRDDGLMIKIDAEDWD